MTLGRRSTHVAVSAAVLAIAACGPHSPTEPSPTPTPATLSLVRVTGPVGLGLPGEGFPMTATAVYSDASTRLVTTDATWTSANPVVASVAASGLVSFLGGGTARISAAYQGLSGSWDVTVIAIDPTDALTVVSMTPSPGSNLTRGATIDFTAQLQYTLAEATGRLAAVAEVNNNPVNVFANITPPVNVTLSPGNTTLDVAGRFTIPPTAGQNVRIFFQLFPAGASRTNVLAIVTFPLQ